MRECIWRGEDVHQERSRGRVLVWQPRSGRPCPYWTLGDDAFCWYHRKKVDELIDVDHERLPGTNRAQIVSEEQLEIARVLEFLGATEVEVRMALTRAR
jgi:hypothetical protein